MAGTLRRGQADPREISGTSLSSPSVPAWNPDNMGPMDGPLTGENKPTQGQLDDGSFMPGSLLGGFGDVGTSVYKPLLPQCQLSQTLATAMQRYLDQSQWFMGFSPQHGGFKTFYPAIVDARNAILPDIARAKSSFGAMGAANTTIVKLITQCLIVVARPRDEAVFIERLAEEGHGAVEAILRETGERSSGTGQHKVEKPRRKLHLIPVPFYLSRPHPNPFKDLNLWRRRSEATLSPSQGVMGSMSRAWKFWMESGALIRLWSA